VIPAPNHPSAHADLPALLGRATAMRRHMIVMARGPGQGYVGQGLGIADVLAALYFHELRYDPGDLQAPARDRFLLSTGHYSLALWAALAETGIIPLDELPTYGADDSRLAMSTLTTTPGVEQRPGCGVPGFLALSLASAKASTCRRAMLFQLASARTPYLKPHDQTGNELLALQVLGLILPMRGCANGSLIMGFSALRFPVS